MFTIIFLILLALVIVLGIVFSPVLLIVGLDILAVVGVIKLIVRCFTRKKRKS